MNKECEYALADGDDATDAQDPPPGLAVAQEVAQRLGDQDSRIAADLGEGAEEASLSRRGHLGYV